MGTQVANVTRDSDTCFKVKRSRSPGRFAHCRIGASGSCSGGRGTCWPWETAATLPSAGAAVGSAARSASAPTEDGAGRGISWRPPAYSTACLVS